MMIKQQYLVSLSKEDPEFESNQGNQMKSAVERIGLDGRADHIDHVVTSAGRGRRDWSDTLLQDDDNVEKATEPQDSGNGENGDISEAAVDPATNESANGSAQVPNGIHPAHPFGSGLGGSDIRHVPVSRHVKNDPSAGDVDRNGGCVEDFHRPRWIQRRDDVNDGKRNESSQDAAHGQLPSIAIAQGPRDKDHNQRQDAINDVLVIVESILILLDSGLRNAQ